MFTPPAHTQATFYPSGLLWSIVRGSTSHVPLCLCPNQRMEHAYVGFNTVMTLDKQLHSSHSMWTDSTPSPGNFLRGLTRIGQIIVMQSLSGKTGRRYGNAFDCTMQIIRQEGVKGLYRGLSASYLGVTESTLHWVLYEQMKILLKKGSDRNQTSIWHQAIDLGGRVGAAGTSKLLAVMITYPHEVIRTRLRQAPMSDGKLRYTSIVQFFRLIWKEEGLMSMYGGLTPHLLRAVPSTAIMFGVFEVVMNFLGDSR